MEIKIDGSNGKYINGSSAIQLKIKQWSVVPLKIIAYSMLQIKKKDKILHYIISNLVYVIIDNI